MRKFGILTTLFILIGGLSIGCSLLKKPEPPTQVALKPDWVRTTWKDPILGTPYAHKMSPLLAGPYIIQGNSDSNISAYRAKTGELVWRLAIEGGVPGGATAHENLVFFGAGDGNFYAVQIGTGQIEWTMPLQATSLSAPTFHEGTVYHQSGDGHLYAIEAATGKRRWSYFRRTTVNLTIRDSSQPAVTDQYVLAGFADGYVVAFDRQTGSIVWEKSLGRAQRFQDVDSMPVVFKDRVYVSHYENGLFSLDLKTGEIVWQLDRGGIYPVLIKDGRIYHSSVEGYLTCLELDSGKAIWEFKSSKGYPTQAVAYKNLILFGQSDGSLMAMEALTGNQRASYATGRGLIATPTVDEKNEKIYLLSNDANLFAISLDWTAETL